jgi:hypothetical protein
VTSKTPPRFALDTPPQIGLLGKLKLKKCAPNLSRDGLGFFVGLIEQRCIAGRALPGQVRYQSANLLRCSIERLVFSLLLTSETSAPQQSSGS